MLDFFDEWCEDGVGEGFDEVVGGEEEAVEELLFGFVEVAFEAGDAGFEVEPAWSHAVASEGFGFEDCFGFRWLL